MITKPQNWDAVPTFNERPKLPVGAYVCRIRNASVDDTYGQLLVDFDISEGKYAGFFAKEFNSSNASIKRWKGVLKLWLPKNDGSEKDDWTKSTFKGFESAINFSNGITWNWDEKTLAGKEIGIIFRNEEWEYNGKTGWAVKPYRATEVDIVRSGDINLPADKPLKNKSASAAQATAPKADEMSEVQKAFTAVMDDDGLPF